MKVLITGGAGFIGSHLTDKLLLSGDKVLVIDNYTTGRRDNLTPHRNLTVVEGTITDKKLVEEIFAKFKPDYVVHAAASYKDPNNWQEDAMTNILGTIYVVGAAKAQKIKRLIYFQTSLCYGLKPLNKPITLGHPLFSGGYSGGSSYAVSKTAAELYIEMSGIEFISFRLANVFGPRNLSGPLPTFFHRLTKKLPYTVADSRRDFLYIGDLIEVVVKALNGMGKRGHYHVSSGKDYSIKELFETVVKAMDIKLKGKVKVAPRSRHDAETILLDPQNTNKDFKWKTKAIFEHGVKAAVEWYKKYGVTQTFTHLKIRK